MGATRSSYGATTFAYAPLLWPKSVPFIISIMESCTGLGLMLGPMIGGGIFSIFKDTDIPPFNDNYSWAYQTVFYSLSAFFLLAIYPSIAILPKD